MLVRLWLAGLTSKTIMTRCPLIYLRFRIKVVLLCFIGGSSETNFLPRARNFNHLWLRHAVYLCQERCVTKETMAAKWTRCFLIGVNDIIWRMLVHYLLNMQRWYAKILGRKVSLLKIAALYKVLRLPQNFQLTLTTFFFRGISTKICCKSSRSISCSGR